MTIFLFTLTFAIIGCFQPTNVLAECGKSDVRNQKGNIVYWRNTVLMENCTWVFHPPQNQTDAVLVLKLIDFRGLHGPCEEYENIIELPHGDRPSNLDNQNYWTSNTRCRAYLKDSLQNNTACARRVLLINEEKCHAKYLSSDQWPPQVKTSFARYAMILQYEFLNCQAPQVVSSATTSDTGAHTTLTGVQSPTSKFKTSSHERKTACSTKQTSTSPGTIASTETVATGIMVQSRLAAGGTLFYVMVAIAIFLVFLTVLLSAALCKMRNRMLKKAEDTELAPRSGENVNEISDGNINSEPANINSAYVMADDDIEHPLTEKETTYNILYERTS